MKILELDGLMYSRDSFENYRFRAKVMIETSNDTFFLDVYTTDTNRENVEKVLLDRKSIIVKSLAIIYWSSKEQDDATTEFINDTLK